jgi:outer membrane biosynthesis protein TonB
LPAGLSCGKIICHGLNRFETRRLAWALALSLVLHFLVWSSYELGKATGLWQRLHWPERKQLAVKKVPPPVVQDSEPAMFLDVDTDQATPDAPKNAKYYSSRNSRAGSPDASRDANQPKLNGKQTDVPQTRDVPRTPNTKEQPMSEAQRNQAKLEALQSLLQAGDVKLAKLDSTPVKTDNTPERPRTLNEARAQQHLTPSMAMQQDGGTRRLVSSLDARATPFGEYDDKIIEAIRQRWYDLLDSQQFAQDRSGKVILQFHLNYDGTVSEMQVLQNTVGELLCYVCQKAVNDPSPFEAWPSDMRRVVGANFREMTFTFYYYSN